MNCPKCGNKSNFNIFFDQLFEVEFKNKALSSVKEIDSDFAQIYPAFCSKCGSMDVVFSHQELERIAKRLKDDD